MPALKIGLCSKGCGGQSAIGSTCTVYMSHVSDFSDLHKVQVLLDQGCCTRAAVPQEDRLVLHEVIDRGWYVVGRPKSGGGAGTNFSSTLASILFRIEHCLP
jgi:hypothetical protein